MATPIVEQVQDLRILWSGACWNVLDIENSAAHCDAWSETRINGTNGVALVRAGGYQRRVNGSTYAVNRAVGFSFDATSEVQSRHAVGACSRLTFIASPPSGTPDELRSRTVPLLVTADLDLHHRLLHKDLEQEREAWEIGMRVAQVLAICMPALHNTPGSRTERRRRELIDQVVELLRQRSTDPNLAEIARRVGYSPFHLSRVFKEATGMGLKEFRQHLRVMRVLDELEGGTDDLSAVAAEHGFADHGHMTRTVTQHLGRTPSSLRNLLGGTPRRRSRTSAIPKAASAATSRPS